MNKTPDKFWALVSITSDDKRCWVWNGSKVKKGYGRFRYKGRNWQAHILSWFLTKGVMPTKWILHSCDNPPCVNPNHLREGTPKENSEDMVSRGRSKPMRGESHRLAKLTELDVIDIRRRLIAGEGQVCIAARYQVSQPAISYIKSGLTWKHVI